MAEKIIACCGMVCTDCGAYIATQRNDDNLRRVQAEKWTTEYKHPFKIEDINCDGCTATGRHVGYCNICEIRKCVQEKKVANCGWCVSYPCGRIGEFLKMVPANKKTLDAVKKGKK
jgi:hypothetical protein